MTPAGPRRALRPQRPEKGPKAVPRRPQRAPSPIFPERFRRRPCGTCNSQARQHSDCHAVTHALPKARGGASP
eukprot:1873983-Pyramimonas_sp.AAC.1